MKDKKLRKIMKRNKGNGYMKRRDMISLQKAINHTNKVLFRLGELELRGVLGTPSSITDCALDIKRHLLFVADEREVAVDPGGMPR